MIRSIFTVVFFVCFYVNVDAQTSTKTNGQDSLDIIQVLKMQEKAWNNGDLKGFMKGYWNNDSLTFVGSKGITYGWDQTLANYIKGYPDKETMGTLSFDILELDVIDHNAAHMLGKYTLKRKADTPFGYFSLVFQRKNGLWRITSDMTVASKN